MQSYFSLNLKSAIHAESICLVLDQLVYYSRRLNHLYLNVFKSCSSLSDVASDSDLPFVPGFVGDRPGSWFKKPASSGSSPRPEKYEQCFCLIKVRLCKKPSLRLKAQRLLPLIGFYLVPLPRTLTKKHRGPQ